MSKCPLCSDRGLPEVCPKCGAISFVDNVTEEELNQVDYVIPAYYRKNQWDSSKIKTSDNIGTINVLQVVDRMVSQVAAGKELQSSYAIMLPYGYGKKTAMFSIIQHYLQYNYSVAPVIDIASLAIMENNFRLNEKKSVEAWEKLITSDLVCTYGVDFSARYQTMKLYLNLCSIRGLRGKPTLLFAGNSLQDLRSSYMTENLKEENNTKDIGCKLSNPIILDGVIGRRTR